MWRRVHLSVQVRELERHLLKKLFVIQRGMRRGEEGAVEQIRRGSTLDSRSRDYSFVLILHLWRNVRTVKVHRFDRGCFVREVYKKRFTSAWRNNFGTYIRDLREIGGRIW